MPVENKLKRKRHVAKLTKINASWYFTNSKLFKVNLYDYSLAEDDKKVINVLIDLASGCRMILFFTTGIRSLKLNDQQSQ